MNNLNYEPKKVRPRRLWRAIVMVWAAAVVVGMLWIAWELCMFLRGDWTIPD
jgi:hypothetical protein